MKKRVADVVFDCLADNDITDCFAVVGGGAMHLDNALAIHPKMKTIFNHHEQACAMAAEAYARYSGKMACVCVTSGPGATNAITGVMGAWVDSIPMIVISGNVRYETSIEKSGLPLRYRGLQEFDIVNSVKNMTKYVCYLTNPETVYEEVEKAIYFAMNGRRGPVWIDIPQDIQNSIIETENLCHFIPENEVDLIDEDAIDFFINGIKNAKRPCILLGSAIQSCHAEEILEFFLAKIKVPIVGGAWNGDVFYSEHPFYFGLSGNAGPRPGNFILQNADFIISLGNSLSYKQTGYEINSFAPNAYICMVDIDFNEYKKNENKVNCFIHMDIVSFMSYIINHVLRPVYAPESWMVYCEKVFERFPSWEGEITASNDRVNKYLFWKCFLDIMPADVLVALGNSSVGMAANQIGRKYKKQRMISNYICGSMGYDLPAAIGIAIASKQTIYCVTGDGSIMMNMQELQTIVFNKLPIKIVIMENEGYGAIRQTCKNFFNGLEFGCSPNTGVGCPSFSRIADAFGYKYNRCENNDELESKLCWLKNEKAPAVLEILQQLDDPVLPKLMSKIDETGKMLSPKLQDMYPFVPDEDMEWLMI